MLTLHRPPVASDYKQRWFIGEAGNGKLIINNETGKILTRDRGRDFRMPQLHSTDVQALIVNDPMQAVIPLSPSYMQSQWRHEPGLVYRLPDDTVMYLGPLPKAQWDLVIEYILMNE